MSHDGAWPGPPREAPPAAPCATCGALTQRFPVRVMFNRDRTNRLIGVIEPECETCAQRAEVAALRASLAKPELLPHLRERYLARVADLTKGDR